MMEGQDSILAAAGVDRSGFDAMCALYREWNERINVISRKDISNIFEHHVLHSLCIAAYLSRRMPQEFEKWRGISAVRVLDLGCGGGFPGIPLALCFPGVEFTLCDSIGKKTLVAQEVASALGLKNVHVVCGRAEQLHGSWDWVVSRAVAPLDTLVEWSRGKFSRGLICLKGGDLAQEISACMEKFSTNGGCLPYTDVWDISQVIADEYYSMKRVLCILLGRPA